MKITAWVWCLVLVAALARGSDQIPLEDFARPPLVSHVQLSVDGKHYAFIGVYHNVDTLYCGDTAAIRSVAGLELGTVTGLPARREVMWFQWLGNKRLLVRVGAIPYGIEGVGACDYDAKNWTPLSGLLLHGKGIRVGFDPLMAFFSLYNYKDDVHVLMLDRRCGDQQAASVLPHVVKLDTKTGLYEQVVKNPGDVNEWVADQKGVVRVGFKRALNNDRMIYRTDAKSPWVPMEEVFGEIKRNAYPLGFDDTGKQLYFLAGNKDNRAALYRCDLASGKVGDPLLELPANDVDYDHAPAYIGPIWSEEKHAVVGYVCEAEGPQVVLFDPALAAIMTGIDQSLPGMINIPVSISAGGKIILVHSFSDTQSGIYHLYDVEKRTLRPLVAARPWIKPEQMAEMHPVHFKARDGLELHGYLTLPVGASPEHLPLVVHPHGGPWVRDTWGFDPLVQMLANRGYAVLQVNYRGSAGYGSDFLNKGKKEVGGAIQQDIEDATHWAIAQKIADPKRIAVIGGSYGGYSALYALGKSPDLFCCGVAIAAVSDWVRLFGNLSEPAEKFSRDYWTEQIGDPSSDKKHLAEISPVNFAAKIVAPLLIIHGEDDTTVPLRQARLMIEALKRAGREPEVLFLQGEEHGFKREASRVSEYKAIEAFLAKHMQGSPSVSPVPAN